MNDTYNPKLKNFSRDNRKNMTDHERMLWGGFLKNVGETVRRQKVIGNYIVDFCIPSVNLIIELDGSQHYSEEGMNHDYNRDRYLTELGYTVKHYSDYDINMNFQYVCEDINSFIESHKE